MKKKLNMPENREHTGKELVTVHQFLDVYPLKPTDELLILGTIHPHFVADFKIPFFYGNRNSLWNLLHDAFPEEIPNDFSLADIVHFLDKRRIAMSDNILRCRRKKNSSLDVDLEVITLNHALIHQIKSSRIKCIYCTSGFGKNSSFRLFYEELLGLKITKEIKVDRKVDLPVEIFGRELSVYILPSPSGAANIALSQTLAYKASVYYGSDSPHPVYDYKVSLYKDYFKYLKAFKIA